tara:strand:- start:414 stop:794 length:381 start_codon:yes stop_codon:yes gene_type:complete
MTDFVNHPPHYQGSIECIDAIEASMSAEAFKGALKANVIKYVWRYEGKGGVESLQKAQWYLNRLIVTIEAEEAWSAAMYETVKEVLAEEKAAYDPDDYMVSGCPDGFCPLPNVRTGPSESMFQPIN